MLVVLLALLGGMAFGAVPLFVRFGLQRIPDATLGALAQNIVGLVVCATAALARTQFEGDVLPFLLVGILVPGISTILLVRAVSAAGPARVSLLMNTAPLISVTGALLLLDEPFHIARLGGAVLIVGGGIVLARERGRPEHVRRIGLVLAVLTGLCFALRDNVVRWIAFDSHVGPQLAGTATIAAAAAITALVYLVERRAVERTPHAFARALVVFAPAGLLLGLAYITMYEALFRGRVTIVSPLLGTASLWAVVLSALLLRRVELVGRTLVLGALLIVGGGALIAIFR